MSEQSAPDERIPEIAAQGFQQGADAYERSRPSYPAEAVACIVGRTGLGPGRRLLDLGAGTGKLTRLLVPTGADVVAVEPVAGMRAQLRAALPDMEVLDGTAESIPLGEASVDVVTVAQAFHWFDAPVALAEIHRVLRPGGALVLTWNTRDRSVGWVRDFGDALDTGRGRPYDEYHEVDYAALVAEHGGGRFGPVERFTCEWSQPFTAELLVARAESVSVVASLPDAERAVVLDRVRSLAETHPELADLPVFAFPYTTSVFWCRRA